MRISSEKMIKTSLILGVMLICLTVVGVILTGISHFKVGSQLAGINQVSNLSHLLVRQQAKLFSLMLVRNAKNDELTEALDAFAQEAFVIDATLYATTGSQLAQSRNALKFSPAFAAPTDEATSANSGEKPTASSPVSPPKSAQELATQQIVEPIFAQQELIGFLRVTFNAQYGQTTQSKVNELFHLLYGELIILFLAGGLFVSCFYALNRKRTAAHTPPRLPQLTENHAASQRFHSRHRAFKRK